jgi:hypothetical protein
LEPCAVIHITRKGDQIYGLYNTTAGQSTGGYDGRYSVLAEQPPSAIDDNVTTKYFNFGTSGCYTCEDTEQAGINSGFFVISSIGFPTVAFGLLFATGNDAPTRDPITVTLEGSNETSIDMLQMASSWTLIYSGSTGISATVDPGRNTYVTPQNFTNTRAFVSYRLLVTSQRGADIGTQYSEAQILGEYLFSVNKCISLMLSIRQHKRNPGLVQNWSTDRYLEHSF